MKIQRRVIKLSDPSWIVEKTAEAYAEVLDEEWDALSPERQMKFRILAYNVLDNHMRNKINGMKLSISVVEDVLCAPSTPKRWLPGVQEAKNALFFALEIEGDALEVRVNIPESVPNGLESHDPYSTLEAGDLDPYEAMGDKSERCGKVHGEGWSCTRPVHPEHFQCWDAEPAEFYRDCEGEILVTWTSEDELTSVHPAVLEYDGPQE